MSRPGAFVKRAFDLVLAFVGMVLTFPVFLIIGILVKLTSPGPALYRQHRVGQHGQLFLVAKFRSMTVGADKQGSITTASDSRITPLGKLLRRSKLDELPQLWNILRGRMSFVGPRPDVPGYADNLTGDDRRVLDLRPGLTGPATLCYRDEEQILAAVQDPRQFNDQVIFPHKVAINLDYLDRWSFGRDLGYIAVTVLPGLDRFLNLVPDHRPPTDAG